MSASVVCPHCSAVLTFHRLPVTSCPQCTQPFPDSLRGQIEVALMRSEAQQPGLLTLGMYGSFLFGVGMVLILIFAPFDVGSYSINGEEVSGPDFLRRVGLATTVVGAVCLAIGYGIWKERLWARPLMLWYWALIGFYGVVANRGDGMGAVLLMNVLFVAVAMGLAGAYLYGNEAVVAYYRALFFRDQLAHRMVDAASGGRGA